MRVHSFTPETGTTRSRLPARAGVHSKLDDFCGGVTSNPLYVLRHHYDIASFAIQRGSMRLERVLDERKNCAMAYATSELRFTCY